VSEKDIVPMRAEEVRVLMAAEPIMKRLGLSLFCLRCHAKGEKDGVEARSNDSVSEVTIRCGCAVRRYVRLD
jgi:hypothetical protein